MKLIRYDDNGRLKQGVIIDDKYYDVSSFGEEYNESFFGSEGLRRLREFVDTNQDKLTSLSQPVKLCSPFARPSKIVCIGLNYAKHAKETGAPIPPEPVIS
jgi:2,4-didehydro-3-deoxy-L-rhamnonate hydrolase